MANVKNFGLVGVGSDLQFGKAGTRIVNNTGVFNFKAADGATDAALLASGITSSAGNVTLTTGNLVLSETTGTIGIAGATVSRHATGVLRFDGAVAFMAPVGDTTARPGTAATGMVRVNSDTPLASTVEFYDGTAWRTVATGGNTALLQSEIDAIEASLGAMVSSSGVWNSSALTDTTIFGVAPASLTAALNNIATYVEGKNTLDEIEPGTGVGKVLYLGAGNTWQQALPGATSGVQAYSAKLTSLASNATNGFVVQDSTGTVVARSLVAPAAGFTITNADGVAGNPTFALADDLAGLEGLTTTGYSVRTGDGTWLTRSFNGVAGQIAITNGDGVGSNTDVGLATVTQGTTGNFVKVTLDGFGRVTGNTAVTTGDITALVDSTYVNVAGDTMTGSLSFTGTATVTGLPAPIDPTDAANKAYVDNAVTGLTWKTAVHLMSVTNVDIASTPASMDGGHPIDAGERLLLINQTTNTENGIYVAGVTGAPMTRALDADSNVELISATVFVQGGTTYANTGWTQSNAYIVAFAGQTWVQFSGAGAYVGGVGIDITGTTISAKLGAGVANLPSGEIGLDIVANKAIQLTTLLTGGQLDLVLDTGSGLTQSATGLKINTAGVTNAMLANPSITLNGDSGSQTLSLGGTLLIAGDGAQGVSTAVTATDTYTITVADATTATKGVSSFASASFTTTAGAVTLNTVDVAHGGTGKTSLTANQALYGNGVGVVGQSANFAFDGTSTLTIGGALPLAFDGALGAITATATNSDLVLMPNGTGSVIVGPAGAGLIQSDIGTALTVRGNTTLTLSSGAGSTSLVLTTGTVNKINVSGPTAADYATGLADTNLVNKYYVDAAIQSGAASGSIKAVKVLVNAAGTTNIGAALPAGATVLSVKVNVTGADAGGTLSVGKSGQVAAYMTTGENDMSATGMYVAEDYVTEASSTQVIATMVGTGAALVIVSYQVA